MLKKIKNKHLLLDTNVLISASKYIDHRDDFFENLKKNYNVEFLIDWSVKFEFLRGSRTKEDLKEKEKFLDFLVGEDRIELTVDEGIVENAIRLSNIYARKDSRLTRQISLADCLLAAQMKKFCSEKGENQLFLASMDLFDFPLCVFDRMEIFVMDVKKEVLNVGIFSFNQKRYKKIERGFQNS